MYCPKCKVQMVREYRKGGHILWKCYLCGYTTVTEEIVDAKKTNDRKGNNGSKEKHL